MKEPKFGFYFWLGIIGGMVLSLMMEYGFSSQEYTHFQQEITALGAMLFIFLAGIGYQLSAIREELE